MKLFHRYLFLVLACLVVFSGARAQEKQPAPPPPAAVKENPDVTLAKNKLDEAVKLMNARKFNEARPLLDDALKLFQKANDRKGEGNALRAIGNSFLVNSDYLKAIDYYKQAFKIANETQDRNGEWRVLNNLGISYNHLRQYSKAVEYYEQALKIVVEIKDRNGESFALNNLGISYNHLRQYSKAVEYYELALKIAREMNDRDGEWQALFNLGGSYNNLSQISKAIDYYEQALKIARDIKDRIGEEKASINLGNSYLYISRYSIAIKYYQQALMIADKIKDTYIKELAMNGLGNSYHFQGNYLRAIEYLEQALQIARENKDRTSEIDVLSNLGNSYFSINHYSKSLEYQKQSLKIATEMKDRDRMENALSNLGSCYMSLGQNSKAIQYFEQYLKYSIEIKDRRKEEVTLNNLGSANVAINKFPIAIKFFDKVLKISREIKDRATQEHALTNLGFSYYNLLQYSKSIKYFEQALAIAVEINDRLDIEYCLSNLGKSYNSLRQYYKAVEYFDQSLKISREIKDRKSEGIAFDCLSLAFYAMKKSNLAVLMGKQAVNVIQSIRADNTALDKDLQKSFLKGNEDSYHNLANLLIEQGRIPEAQQVINMLKEDEFFGYIRRDAGEIPLVETKLYLNPEEKTILKEYSLIADKVTEIGVEYNNLLKKPELTKEEITHRNDLEKQLASASKAFDLFLKSLETNFKEKPDIEKKAEALKDSQNLISTLKDIGNNCVVVYSLMTEESYLAIVTTENGQVARQYKIKKTLLNQKINDLISALKDPRLDPRPLSHELYKILIGPIEKDLNQAHAKSIAWELDDTLRYLPFDALYDGKQYMIEKYGQSVITPASNVDLIRKPAANWSALGLGVTKKHDEFIALPNVSDELNGIVKSTSDGKTGVLDGDVLLDEKFTQAAMHDTLLQKHPSVVHIASHFNFVPGSEEDSFLLLGDGNHYTLDQVKHAHQIFHGVDMLTLSACDTAVGGARNGKEIEGFGVIAQLQGARSLLASLWSVDDASTSMLMQEFYRLHQSQTGISRVEALRQAQLALLHGTIKPSEYQTAHRGMKVLTELSNPKLPKYVEDTNAPFAHPYYWAPFILIGNWQ